jgi:acyl-coenzyme A thioesterase PaaI-like protein
VVLPVGPRAGESLHTWFFRVAFNLWPCFRGTGGRLVYASADWRRLTLRLSLSWRTRNVVGTIFGGSLYASIDPIYMLMLMRILGKGYIVWDKAAAIRFRRPGTETLHAEFHLPEEEIAEIRRLADMQRSVDRVYLVEYKDSSGTVIAAIEKLSLKKYSAPPPKFGASVNNFMKSPVWAVLAMKSPGCMNTITWPIFFKTMR